MPLISAQPEQAKSPGAETGAEPTLRPARPVDQRCRPVLAVWELTLRCDLSCRHCGSRAGKARSEELGTGAFRGARHRCERRGRRRVGHHSTGSCANLRR